MLDSWRAGLAPLASGVLALLMAGLGSAAIDETATEAATRLAANAAERQAWLTQTEKSPHSAAHDGLYLSRPLPPLAWIDRGVDPVAGALIRLEVHEPVRVEAPPLADRPVSQRLIDVSLATVWQLLVPLLVGVLVATALAREREQGTLAWIAVSGSSPRRAALGIALGAIALPIATIVAVLFPLALTAMRSLDRSAWPTLGAVLGAHAIWWSCAAAFAAAAALRAATSAQALTRVTLTWAVTVLLAPSFAAGVAEAWAPTPSAFEIGQQLAAARATLPTLYQRIERLEREDVPAGVRLRTPKGRALLEEEADLNRIADDVHASLTQIHDRQWSIRRWLSIALPVLAVQDLSSAIVGTDSATLRRFEADTEAYRRTMVRLLNEAEAEFGDAEAAPYLPAYLAGTEVWSRLDPFSSPAGGARDPSAISWPLAVLLAWAAGFAAWTTRLAWRWRP